MLIKGTFVSSKELWYAITGYLYSIMWQADYLTQCAQHLCTCFLIINVEQGMANLD
jgi:hypothetical protein